MRFGHMCVNCLLYFWVYTHDSMNSDYAVNDSLFLILPPLIFYAFMILFVILPSIITLILYQYIINFSCNIYTLYPE